MIEILMNTTVESEIKKTIDAVKTELPDAIIRIVFPNQRKIEPVSIDETWKIRAKDAGITF